MVKLNALGRKVFRSDEMRVNISRQNGKQNFQRTQYEAFTSKNAKPPVKWLRCMYTFEPVCVYII